MQQCTLSRQRDVTVPQMWFDLLDQCPMLYSCIGSTSGFAGYVVRYYFKTEQTQEVEPMF